MSQQAGRVVLLLEHHTCSGPMVSWASTARHSVLVSRRRLAGTKAAVHQQLRTPPSPASCVQHGGNENAPVRSRSTPEEDSKGVAAFSGG